MKDIIHKVLRETKELHNIKSRVERVDIIEYNKKYIEKLLPTIVKLFEHTFKDDIDKIEVEKTDTRYGNENFKIESFKLIFYFNQIPKDSKFSITRDIIQYLRDMFDIDITRYGIPLSITVLLKEWKEYKY
jgi:hypothetical protein